MRGFATSFAHPYSPNGKLRLYQLFTCVHPSGVPFSTITTTQSITDGKHTRRHTATISMEEDPDDLAAAFFAAEAKKEAQRGKLFTEDWVDAITSMQRRAWSDGTSNDGVNDNIASLVNEWLVTTIPSAPQKHDVFITMNTDECTCNLVRPKNHETGKLSTFQGARDEKVHEIREQLKQALVQKLLEEYHFK